MVLTYTLNDKEGNTHAALYLYFLIFHIVLIIDTTTTTKIIINTLFKRRHLDKRTSIYHMFLNIEPTTTN